MKFYVGVFDVQSRRLVRLYSTTTSPREAVSLVKGWQGFIVVDAILDIDLHYVTDDADMRLGTIGDGGSGDPGTPGRWMPSMGEVGSVVIDPAEVWAEKDTRWARGFDYPFPDARGTHRIATAPKDLEDWNKVSVAAQALINLGQPNATIDILTETGPVTVTALEWQRVLLATAQFMQPIFAAAALLAAMDPIPTNYADDQHWPPS